MKKEKIADSIPAFVLGALDEDEKLFILKHWQKPGKNDLREMADFGDTVSRLLFAAQPVAPRPELKNKILSRNGEKSENDSRHLAQDDPFVFLRADEGSWQSLREGVTAKTLYRDMARQTTTMLIRMEAGSIFPGHAHQGPEELYVLEGDCYCAGELLYAGDYHRAEEGSEHGITKTEHGCMMLVISPEIDIFE